MGTAWPTKKLLGRLWPWCLEDTTQRPVVGIWHNFVDVLTPSFLFKEINLTFHTYTFFFMLSLNIQHTSALLSNQSANNFWFWESDVEALDEFPSYFIQSKTSTSAHEYSEVTSSSDFSWKRGNWGYQRSETGNRRRLEARVGGARSQSHYRNKGSYLQEELPPKAMAHTTTRASCSGNLLQ